MAMNFGSGIALRVIDGDFHELYFRVEINQRDNFLHQYVDP